VPRVTVLRPGHPNDEINGRLTILRDVILVRRGLRGAAANPTSGNSRPCWRCRSSAQPLRIKRAGRPDARCAASGVPLRQHTWRLSDRAWWPEPSRALQAGELVAPGGGEESSCRWPGRAILQIRRRHGRPGRQQAYRPLLVAGFVRAQHRRPAGVRNKVEPAAERGRRAASPTRHQVRTT